MRHIKNTQTTKTVFRPLVWKHLLRPYWKTLRLPSSTGCIRRHPTLLLRRLWCRKTKHKNISITPHVPDLIQLISKLVSKSHQSLSYCDNFDQLCPAWNRVPSVKHHDIFTIQLGREFVGHIMDVLLGMGAYTVTVELHSMKYRWWSEIHLKTLWVALFYV